MNALRLLWASFLALYFLANFSNRALSQTCGPECRALNLSITSTVVLEYHSKVFWTDLIPNFSCAGPVTYLLQTVGGSFVAQGSSDDLGNQSYFIIKEPCKYLKDGLMVIISNNLGSCMNRLTFKKGPVNFSGRHLDLFCLDPRAERPGELDFPAPILACDGAGTPRWVGDWPVIKQCLPGIQDTAKVIYREWEIYDKEGFRSTTFDTLIVFRFPQLDETHLYCTERDTLYCGESESFGPFIIFETQPGSGICDTLFLVESLTKNGQISFAPIFINSTCGLQLHLDTAMFSSGCEEIWKLDLEIKQTCSGADNQAPCFVPVDNQVQRLDQPGKYWRCTFWVYNLDTVAPKATCDYSHYNRESIFWPRNDISPTSQIHCFETPASPDTRVNAPVLIVSTDAHSCSAFAALPGLCVSEEWSGIKNVRASIEGVGTFILNEKDSCEAGLLFESPELVRLPLSETPYQIIYEVADGCHNIDSIFCYILVKDAVKPVAVANKGVTVSLSGKIAWVEAASFDEGSYDNCQLNVLLARRTDWSTAGVDLCDARDTLCTYHGQVIFRPILQPDKKLNEIEAHYAKTLKWLEQDQNTCNRMLLNAWNYGLLEASYKQCGDSDLSQEEFMDLFHNLCAVELWGSTEKFGCQIESDRAELLKSAAEIGGGWSQEVPFTCEDACQTVVVEIIAIDYWCNWSKSWTEVKVEDRTPLSIAQDLDNEIEISCATYKKEQYALEGIELPVSLKTIVGKASSGNLDAIKRLDELLGGYEKAWIDPNGILVDGQGDTIPRHLAFHDRHCICEEVRKSVKVYDDHLGYQWVDSTYHECRYKDTIQYIKQGLVAVNCTENIQCHKTVWSDLDHCGQGYIYRKFEITSGCASDDDPHSSSVITRLQRIKVTNNCELSKAMFVLPVDTAIYNCMVEYDPKGSGNVAGAADPSVTGYPQYRFDDDCRIVGVAYSDKVFKVVGGDQACYKIVRSWFFTDWCQQNGPSSSSPEWWKNRELVVDTCIQIIVLIDTMPPLCVITGPVSNGGEVIIAGCSYDFSAELDVLDACGIGYYDFQLFKNGQSSPLSQGSGELDSHVSTHVTLSALALEGGKYQLRARVIDECQNEGFCTYEFTIDALKKPSPVCLSNLTVELVPGDLDDDGVPDTATAIVWAREFDRSSIAPCGSAIEDLKFYIELFSEDNGGFETLDTIEDQDHIMLGCKDIGIQTVRMWVLSPSGSADYCDVYLRVQANAGGCVIVDPVFSTLQGAILTMDGKGVKNVSITGSIDDVVIEDILTDLDGKYSMLFGLGEVVTLQPSKDGDDQNGVTTPDLIAMANHINNSAPLVSPYRRIAADVNFDGIINALDLLLLRNLILNNIPEWPNGESWRFVPAAFLFESSVAEAEDFPGSITKELSEPITQVDFTAIKVGDLNLDRNTQLPGRSGDLLVMQLSDFHFLPGEPVVFIPKFTSDITLQGMQFELQFDADVLEFSDPDFDGGVPLEMENLGLRLVNEGTIYCSWFSDNKIFLNDQEGLFEFNFIAKKAGKLSDAFSLVAHRLASEGYPDATTIKPIALSFSEQQKPISLVKNFPNPFSDLTHIEVDLHGDNNVRLVISDVKGKVLIDRQLQFSRSGKEALTVTASELGAPGVYYYSLITASEKITKRMIMIH
ncbi:MAG: T9SS type A sorting domain-containing protein [Saprospiraceae bacterium]|nr:T9SS type A sorting domain-containing protein [Saprospiraceae bacterium]